MIDLLIEYLLEMSRAVDLPFLHRFSASRTFFCYKKALQSRQYTKNEAADDETQAYVEDIIDIFAEETFFFEPESINKKANNICS